MARADEAQWVTRVNQAFTWLRSGMPPPEVTRRLTANSAISARQAARYVQEAQRLDGPLASVDAKVVFTVKLSKGLVDRLHRYSESTGQTLSHIVNQALTAWFRRGGRG